MIAFAAAWGVFWLLVWSGLLALAVFPPMSGDDKNIAATAFMGAAVSVCWLIAVAVAAVLS